MVRLSNRRERNRSLPALWIAACAAPFVWALSAAADEPIDLDLYGRLLQEHTREVSGTVGTVVDYRALKASPEWTRLVAQLETAKPSRASRDERLAFWINAYNILTIDLILKHYPIDGIKDIGSFFSPVWNVDVATIEGRTISLGEIEHDVLRKMDEPRIHGAIVCASISCPPLSRTPFRAARIDADLTTAMRRWLLNREKGVTVDRDRETVFLSKIFDWFEEDFESRGGVLASITPFLDASDAEWIRAQGASARIRYFPYDWSLNDAKRFE